MSMQTPGSFIFAYTIHKSPETNVFSWITYLVGGICQGILLVICLWLRNDHGDFITVDPNEASHE